jgi:hypothetical protein
MIPQNNSTRECSFYDLGVRPRNIVRISGVQFKRI